MDTDDYQKNTIKPVQQQILDALADKGPMTRREISLVLNINSSNLSSPLARLLRWKLIIEHGFRHSVDRRARRYALANSYIYVPYQEVVELSKTKVFLTRDQKTKLIDAKFSELANKWLEDA